MAEKKGSARKSTAKNAPAEDARPSAAAVNAAAKAADADEEAIAQNTYRVDRGEALPPQAPPRTATDSHK